MQDLAAAEIERSKAHLDIEVVGATRQQLDQYIAAREAGAVLSHDIRRLIGANPEALRARRKTVEVG